MPKPSLYATLPVGTRVHVETCFGNPYGGWYYAAGEVVEDLGEQIRMKADKEWPVPSEFTIYKCRIKAIL
jgi:hypothetical protein